ncbi:MAG: hypothetical protein JSU93_04820 [Methanobacteriota archaeon]|nr:MAG: hypothetical protein JSU93_04820 [Euryarchaeota archaeon]
MTLLAVLQILSGLQLLFVAIVAFIIASVASTPEVQEELSSSVGEKVADSIAVIFFVIGVAALAIALFSFVLARGYLKGREWARRRGRKIALFAIILAVLSLILIPARTDPGAPIWTILLNLFILAYLGRKRVRAFFR